MTRVLFANLFHETHTFLPEPTRLSDFETLKGEETFRRLGDGSNIDGFLSRAKAHGWTVPPTGVGTADTPMRDLEALARRIEGEGEGVQVANVVAGVAFADVPDVGVSFTIASDGDARAAEAALDRLEAEAIRLKEAGVPRDQSVDEVLRKILPIADGPVLLVEPSDNIGGGTTGDGTGILRALIRHKVRDAAVVIADPESVAALVGARIGDTAHLSVGGRRNPFDEGPVEMTATLRSRSDGRFTLEDPRSHLAAFGHTIDMGPSAVVEHEGIRILLSSRKIPPWDLGQLRSQGIEPTWLKVIGVKAAVAHRRAYDPIAKASYTVATPGPGMSDLTRFPYRKVRRPLYPVDDIGE